MTSRFQVLLSISTCAGYYAKGFSDPVHCASCKGAADGQYLQGAAQARAAAEWKTPDTIIKCRDCPQEFVFTGSDQDYFTSKVRRCRLTR